MKVLVLGSGMVGSVVAADLAATPDFHVTVADASAASLERAARRSQNRIRTLKADAGGRTQVQKLISRVKPDMVVGALPSRFGFAAMQGVIQSGLPYVDISFMPEDFLELDRAARKAGVPVVADMGVAPGMSNMLAGWAAHTLDKCQHIEILVGGLPKARAWPWQYKAPFSHHDVIEEYVRPSRVVEHGQVVEKEALSEPELVSIPGVGTLEAFYTDGLRSLARTLKVPHMREKTMRYPGHAELMRTLRHVGLFSTTPVKVGKTEVRPLDVLAALLFPHWTYQEGEPDITVMTVRATGTHRGRHVRMAWTLHDELDPATGFSSMARTTGFPATAVARMVASGRIRTPGVHAPEMLGKMPGVLDLVLADLRARGVVYTPTMEEERKPAARKAGARKAATRASATRKPAARTSAQRTSGERKPAARKPVSRTRAGAR
ncbi:MAG: saccharopine dehydrogenase C-terminal domain-containing protein [Phycisphaerales bacterium]